MSWRVMPSRGTIVDNSARNKRYKVIAVPDGDTILIAGGPHRQSREWLRLLNVDAPEHGQIGFHLAKAFLKDLVFEKWITIEPEKLWKWRRGKYGRTLVYVYQEGVLVNSEIVREGWSDYWTRYGRGRLQSIFQRCLCEATEEKKGVWQFYKQDDCWRFGRGRAKQHFRSAQELIERVRRHEEKEDLKDGKIFTYSGSTPRSHIRHRIFPK